MAELIYNLLKNACYLYNKVGIFVYVMKILLNSHIFSP